MKTLSFDMNTIDFDTFAANMRDCCVENEDAIEAEYEKFKVFQLENEYDWGQGNIGTTVEVIWLHPTLEKHLVSYTSFPID